MGWVDFAFAIDSFPASMAAGVCEPQHYNDMTVKIPKDLAHVLRSRLDRLPVAHRSFFLRATESLAQAESDFMYSDGGNLRLRWMVFTRAEIAARVSLC